MMAINSKSTGAVFLMVAALSCSVFWGGDVMAGPYLDQEPPGLTPIIFAPGVISVANRYEDGVTFTPDGLECCVAVTDAGWATCRLEYTQQVDGQWTTPRRAYFQGNGDGWTCQFALDGLAFVFISTPTGSPDIWVSERASVQDRWSAPSRIPAPVSPTSEREWAPSVTLDRTLYWTSPRAGTRGANDIWRSRYVDGGYETVENIGPPVNTGTGEQSAFIAPDESYLIFTCGGRPDTHGSSDLYVSFRDEDDTWTEPVNLGSAVNTVDEERCPYVSFDGKYLFFTRRSGSEADVYWVSTGAFLADPNGPIENLRTGERFNSIQHAVSFAEAGDTIVLQPGLYEERLDLAGKDVVLQSVDPTDPCAAEATVIQGAAENPVIRCSGNSAACALRGLTLTGGLAGLSLQDASPCIEYCRIMDNAGSGIEMEVKSNPTIERTLICANGGAGIAMTPAMNGRWPVYNEPSLINCTVAHNAFEGITGGVVTLRNCIVWGNGGDVQALQVAPVEATVRYSCIEGGFDGEGNMDANPLFLTDGDHHLHPDSPCIDGGDPADDPGDEPVLNGGRINMGAYGGTLHATRALASD
jgi:Right handed beta helix region/WD40-like Beta Propeller Repeat